MSQALKTCAPMDTTHFRFGRRVIIALMLLALCELICGAVRASAADSPLVLEKEITIPGVPLGPYSDHMAVDVGDGFLFATPQAAHAVAVVDLKAGRVVKMLPAGNPHGVFFSRKLKRLFVVDGQAGAVKVFSTVDYSLVKTIPLTIGADGLAYDPHSQLIYVMNGGEDARMNHSLLSGIDPVGMQKVADIPIPTAGLEGAAVDPTKELAYLNMDEADNAVAVVDLTKRRTVAIWKLQGKHRSKAIALDKTRSRLYVACRDSAMQGSILVLNASNGLLVARLPIGGWADGMFVDHKRQRIYVSTGLGYIETYAIESGSLYRRLPSVATAILAKTSLYSSGADRMYIDVPQLGSGSDDQAKVLVFRPEP